MAQTMAWRTEGRLHVLFQSKRSPTSAEWAGYMNAMRPHVGADLRFVILSRGGAPDGDQRRALMSMVGNARKPPTALLTDSVVVRGITAAFHLFAPVMKAFATSELQAAGNFLSLTPTERERAAALLAELEREIATANDDSPRAH